MKKMRIMLYRLSYMLRKLVNLLMYYTVYRLLYRKIMIFKDIYKAQNYRASSIKFMRDDTAYGTLSSSNIITNSSIVIDVGGETGIWAKQIFDRYQPNMYISEPNPHSIAILKRNFEGDKFKILPYGIGGKNTKIQLSVSGMGSSVFDSSPGYQTCEKVEIELKDVVEVFRELELESVDMIKINIEGGEYELLERMIESSVASKCKIIRIQFHEWFPNAYALKRKIRKRLKKTHRIEWEYELVWESWIRKDINVPK